MLSANGAHIYDTLSTFQVVSFDITEIQTHLYPATAKSIMVMSNRGISLHQRFRDSEIVNEWESKASTTGPHKNKTQGNRQVKYTVTLTRVSPYDMSTHSISYQFGVW